MDRLRSGGPHVKGESGAELRGRERQRASRRGRRACQVGRRVSGGALAGRAWGGAGLRVSGAREFGPARGWAKGERGAWAAAGERKGPVGLGRGVGAGPE